MQFKPLVIGALMLSVTGFQTTTQARNDNFTEPTISEEEKEEFIGRWVGFWNGNNQHRGELIITSINPFEIEYCHRGYVCARASKKKEMQFGGKIEKARFKGKRLQFRWEKSRFRFEIKNGALKGKMVEDRGHHDHIHRIKMKREEHNY